MTDQQPPAGPPEFTPPPDGTVPQLGSAPTGPGATSPSFGQPPVAGPGAPNAASSAGFLPPGSMPPGAVPPPGRPQGDVPPPPPGPPAVQPQRGGGSIWLGVIIGIGSTAAFYGLYTLLRQQASDSLGGVLDLMATGWIFILFITGFVLALIRKTTRTGAGILLSIGIAILVTGGLCVALLAGFSL